MEYEKITYCEHNYPVKVDDYCPKCILEWKIEMAAEDFESCLRGVLTAIEQIKYAVKEFTETSKLDRRLRFDDPEQYVIKVMSLSMEEIENIERGIKNIHNKLDPFKNILKETK